MKKLFNKIINNKLLFSIFIISCTALFWVISRPARNFIENLFYKLIDNSNYGIEFISELFWFIVLIPIILIFKNKYIFSQKKTGFFKSLKLVWPALIYTSLVFFQSASFVNFSDIRIIEVISLILFMFTIGLFEEVMCRGWIQNEFIEKYGKDRKGVIFSIIISGVIFGLIHSTNILSGQAISDTIIQIISCVIGGIFYGAVYYKTKNIWVVVFLHAFWDFALFFSDINIATTCIINEPVVENALTNNPIFMIITFIISFVSMILSSFPELGNGLMLLNKEEINLGLPIENQEILSDKQMKKSRKSKKVLKILLIIYLSIFGLITLLISLFSFLSNNFIEDEEQKCPKYIDKVPENYLETFADFKEYNITSNNANLYFKINENDKLEIVNQVTNESQVLEYENVDSFVIFENNNNYEIIILSYLNSGEGLVYHSNYLTLDKLKSVDLTELLKSFKQILVPNTIFIGYYQENNSKTKYPLFISTIHDYYILYPNGEIYKY